MFRFHHPRHLVSVAFIILLLSIGACDAGEEDEREAEDVEGEYSVTSKVEQDSCSSGAPSNKNPILVTLKKMESTACSGEGGNDCSEIFYTMSPELFRHKSLAPKGNAEPALNMGAYFNYIDECVSYDPIEPCPPKSEDESGRLSLERDNIYSGDWEGTYQQAKGNCTIDGKVWFRKTN